MDKEKDNGITRRDALKRMGMLVAGAFAATAGMPALTSCADRPERKRLVLYFTATGNCLYVARQLVQSEEQLLSIPQLMKQGRFELEADEIGLVYPIYGHMPPNMVRTFIRKARLTAKYKFAVLTYGMLDFNAAELWDDIAARAGTKFDYINTLVMVDNWLPAFDMNEQMKMDKHIPENLGKITDDIAARKHWVKPATERDRQAHNGFMAWSGLDPEVGFLKKSEQYFRVTDACIGCAVCTEVCPHGNYKLTSEGVKAEGDCDLCLACIHNCPQKAIRFQDLPHDPLLAQGERNPDARYRNEHVSLWSIKEANRQ